MKNIEKIITGFSVVAIVDKYKYWQYYCKNAKNHTLHDKTVGFL